VYSAETTSEERRRRNKEYLIEVSKELGKVAGEKVHQPDLQIGDSDGDNKCIIFSDYWRNNAIFNFRRCYSYF
jgi:hypothetical protein